MLQPDIAKAENTHLLLYQTIHLFYNEGYDAYIKTYFPTPHFPDRSIVCYAN